jgi:multicomponent Na+:H+ antiporter subunit A
VIATSLVILLGLAIVAPPLHRLAPRFAGLFFAAVLAGLGVMYATLVSGFAGGETRAESWQWVTQLDVALTFRLDGLALTFALLICFVGAIVLLYTSSYLRGHPRLGGFYATLIAFMVSMLGLVVADNVFLVFVFWELTSITSFLLIGFEHERASARRAALQALLVTGLGGLVLLAGLVMLGLSAGTFNISEIDAATVTGGPYYAAIVVLVLIGCFSKSAIVPFHFWLPNAMEAPSPVSALLHSSTMVKAGVYLVARLHPTLGGSPLWDDVLILFGGVTMLIAAFLATRGTKLKSILAYSTVSSLGVLMMLIGMGASKAAATYLIAHAMFKGCLFLVAGSITHATGEKNPEKLGNLFKHLPLVSTAGILGALSLAGMFPFAGFVGKELLIKAGLGHPEYATAATIVIVVAAVLTVVAACMVGIKPLFGKEPEGMHVHHPADWRQWLGPMLLALGGLVAGLAPAAFARPLVAATVISIDGAPYDGALKLFFLDLLWPPTLATWLSIIALILGAGLYAARRLYRRITTAPRPVQSLNADNLYDLFLAGFAAFAEQTTRVIQNGHLHSYVRTILLAIIGISIAATLRADALGEVTRSIFVMDALIAGAIICSAGSVLFLRSALAAVAVLGGIGFLMACVFVLYGAPDVAMTSFAVETLVVIIFVLVLYYLPRLRNLTSTPRRISDGLVATAFGVVMGIMAFASATRHVTFPVSGEHAALSVPEGFGRNVVNVILVDFRAMDTLGEIFVLGIAAIGVYTLLAMPSRNPQEAPS